MESAIQSLERVTAVPVGQALHAHRVLQIITPPRVINVCIADCSLLLFFDLINYYRLQCCHYVQWSWILQVHRWNMCLHYWLGRRFLFDMRYPLLWSFLPNLYVPHPFLKFDYVFNNLYRLWCRNYLPWSWFLWRLWCLCVQHRLGWCCLQCLCNQLLWSLLPNMYAHSSPTSAIYIDFFM